MCLCDTTMNQWSSFYSLNTYPVKHRHVYRLPYTVARNGCHGSCRAQGRSERKADLYKGVGMSKQSSRQHMASKEGWIGFLRERVGSKQTRIQRCSKEMECYLGISSWQMTEPHFQLVKLKKKHYLINQPVIKLVVIKKPEKMPPHSSSMPLPFVSSYGDTVVYL